MISNQNIMNLEPRQKIYNHIKKYPGLHLREISRQMKIPKTTLDHHLKYLNKQDLITIKKERRYKRYYVANKLGIKEKEILNLLRQEVPRNILFYLTFYVVCSEIELSKALDKHPATIDFHLKKLKKLGIVNRGWKGKTKIAMEEPIGVRRDKDPNENMYYIDGDEYRYIILSMLMRCKNSLTGDQDFVKEILNFTHEITNVNKSKKRLSLKKGLLNRINNPDSAIDVFLEKGYDIFPHPYHA